LIIFVQIYSYFCQQERADWLTALRNTVFLFYFYSNFYLNLFLPLSIGEGRLADSHAQHRVFVLFLFLFKFIFAFVNRRGQTG